VDRRWNSSGARLGMAQPEAKRCSAVVGVAHESGCLNGWKQSGASIGWNRGVTRHGAEERWMGNEIPRRRKATRLDAGI
jgi:hypothetical protein